MTRIIAFLLASLVTIELPELLKEELDAYAAEHGKLYEPVKIDAFRRGTFAEGRWRKH